MLRIGADVVEQGIVVSKSPHDDHEHIVHLVVVGPSSRRLRRLVEALAASDHRVIVSEDGAMAASASAVPFDAAVDETLVTRQREGCDGS
jgi:hypothetical protein